MAHSTYCLILVNDQVLVDAHTKLPVLWDVDTATIEAKANHLFVGCYSGAAYYVAQLSEMPFGDFTTSGLRPLLGNVPQPLWDALVRATQLVSWQQHHLFCSRCGAATQQTADYCALCPACGHTQYPRIHPCVMVLITRNNSSEVLLAKSSRPNTRHYSLIAGFIEAGESAERAAVREVFEEVGLSIGDLRFVCSQAWPFSQSLMLGFTANYVSGELALAADEIVDAYWCSRVGLENVVLPDCGTLSRLLIDRWREGEFG